MAEESEVAESKSARQVVHPLLVHVPIQHLYWHRDMGIERDAASFVARILIPEKPGTQWLLTEYSPVAPDDSSHVAYGLFVIADAPPRRALFKGHAEVLSIPIF